jgi:hypothetical protein
MINPRQFLIYVVRPTLAHLNLHSSSAEHLIMGTIAHESKMGEYLNQIQGPALGVAQMEPATHDDIWYSYLAFRPNLREKVMDFVPPWAMKWDEIPDAHLLRSSLDYSVAMARVHYYRVVHPLPSTKPDDLAAYWKLFYNTKYGKGTEAQFKEAYASISDVWEDD